MDSERDDISTTSIPSALAFLGTTLQYYCKAVRRTNHLSSCHCGPLTLLCLLAVAVTAKREYLDGGFCLRIPPWNTIQGQAVLAHHRDHS
ncbi:hypothetical protein GWI33_011714 [Rhynchophorus ferrugineus]|uniref:Uncharacterized protein n=1 Tax=Rhynchophorus ferrugineus TaxID=354439 RepID=A0A834MJ43_RHYFE|nr:hypothetical protein GWI33_011714 [Rhynchophorus ferrugineus]